MKGVELAGPDYLLAYYESPDQLAEAGRDLLYGPPDIHAAIIDGFHGSYIDTIALGQQMDYDEVTRLAMANIPQLAELTAIARDWTDSHYPTHTLRNLQVFPRSNSIPLHYDDEESGSNDFTGPLTFSLRLGGYGCDGRQFYVARTKHNLITTDGELDIQAKQSLDDMLDQRESQPIRMALIPHIAGRMIMIRNTEQPTLHAVRQTRRKPGFSSVVGEWGMGRKLTP